MALSCMTKYDAMYLDTHVIIFFTITNIIATSSVHVVVERRNHGSCGRRDHLATPKRLGGATIWDLEMHVMTRIFALLRDMCQQDQP